MTPTDVSAVLKPVDYSIANVVKAGEFLGSNALLFNGVMFSIAGMYIIFFLKLIRTQARPRA